jgi:hypothetical protein
MTRNHLVALASLALFAAGMASADKFGRSASDAIDTKGRELAKREMPKNDDFQSVTMRAAGGGSSPGCCPADFDCNGVVDGSDIAILLGSWGFSTNDLDGDGIVTAADLAILLGAWGPCVG